MKRCLAIALTGGFLYLLVGCESPEPTSPQPSPAASGVSAIPWNKPASWEGAGALGGFMPQGAH